MELSIHELNVFREGKPSSELSARRITKNESIAKQKDLITKDNSVLSSLAKVLWDLVPVEDIVLRRILAQQIGEKNSQSFLCEIVARSISFADEKAKKVIFCVSGYSLIGNANQKEMQDSLPLLNKCKEFWKRVASFKAEISNINSSPSFCVEFSWY